MSSSWQNPHKAVDPGRLKHRVVRSSWLTARAEGRFVAAVNILHDEIIFGVWFLPTKRGQSDDRFCLPFLPIRVTTCKDNLIKGCLFLNTKWLGLSIWNEIQIKQRRNFCYRKKNQLWCCQETTWPFSHAILSQDAKSGNGVRIMETIPFLPGWSLKHPWEMKHWAASPHRGLT